MAVRRILQLGEALLHDKSTPVESVADAMPVLVDLRDTLHEFRRTRGFGRGISAIQIGEPKRLIYIEFEGVAYSLINPRMVWHSEETFRLWDDCFSFPDLLVEVERFERIAVEYTNELGEAKRM